MNITMKKFHSTHICFAVFAACIFGATMRPALAQQNAADTATQQWRKIHLQYIHPDMLAYWLDSARQPMPPEYQQKTSPSLQPGFQKMLDRNYDSHPIFTKPGGYVVVDQTITKPKLSVPSDEPFDGLLTADDSKDDLWILSTQYVFDKTQKLADQLDQPLQQIELKVEVVIGDTDTMKAFMNMESPTQPDQKPSEIQPMLDQLKEQGKVKIYSLSPITALNGFTGSASSFVTTPVIFSTQTSGIGSELSSHDESPSAYFTRYFYAVANPTLNKDNTVTVLLTVGATNIFTEQKPPTKITDAWIDNIVKHTQLPLQYLSTVCTLANNRIMMLGGLRNISKRINTKLVDQETVWFITAHYVK